MFVMMVISLLNGCHHKDDAYDIRLIAADSIMHDDASMALDMLNSIKTQSLGSERNRAYHALLLSQARYRNYVVATSDSLINVSLNYYKHHQNEREKLTRAYIYKGAIMEELGDNHQAMVHYKKALTTAATDDAFNQGYARLRLGCIYRINIVADSDDITLFKEALRYFKQVPDSNYTAICLNEIGMSYFKTNKDSVLPYLEKSLAVARAMQDTGLEGENLRTIAEFKMFSKDSKDIETAKQIAYSLLSFDNQAVDLDGIFMILAYTLARQNKVDSATHYLSKVFPNQIVPGSRVFYYRCLAEVSRCQGNVAQYQQYYEYSDEIADSITNNSTQNQLRDIETKYDNEALQNENLRYKIILIASILGGLLLLSCLVIALLVIKHRFARNKQLLKESELTIERLHNDAERLSSQLNANIAMSDNLKDAIRHQIDTFTQLVTMHNKQFLKDPKSFSAMFRKSYMINQPDTSFWMGIRAYVNSIHNDIIDRLEELHPTTLKDSDIHYLCLHYSGLPSSVVMLCMGYNDIHSLYNKKRRILNKLGLSYDDSLTKDVLDEYLVSLDAVVNKEIDEIISNANTGNEKVCDS